MTPLVPILVIMLLTVVYNESQYIADYQDDYEKILAKNVLPFELCDETSKKKICKTSNIWREFLKHNDDLLDDVYDFSREYAHDYIDEEDTKTQKVGQKRNYANKMKNKNCHTLKTPVVLGNDFYPNVIGNVSCDSAANNEDGQMCSKGWNCQPVEYTARVLSKHSLKEKIPSDIPKELQGCWLFKEIPINVGCRCGRS